LEIGEGNYQVQFVNTITGSYDGPVIIQSIEGILTMDLEIPDGELAIKITKE